jgi:hypothetical protein
MLRFQLHSFLTANRYWDHISLSQRRLLEHFTSCPFEQTRVAEEPLKFSSVLLSLGAFIVG